MELNKDELILIRDALGQFILDGFVDTKEESELLEGLLNKINNTLKSIQAPTESLLPEEYKLWNELTKINSQK